MECTRPQCQQSPVAAPIVCSICHTATYCGLTCQRMDWARHSCIGDKTHREPALIGAPMPCDGQRVMESMQQATQDTLDYLDRMYKLAKDDRGRDELHRLGYVGRGVDSLVLSVVVAGQRRAMKISMATGHSGHGQAATLLETSLHTTLHRATSHGPSGWLVVPIHDDFQIFARLEKLILALRANVRHERAPTDPEMRLATLLAAQMDIMAEYPITASVLTFTPMSLYDLHRNGSTTEAQFNALYAQIVASVAVLGEAGVTHGDLHSENVRLVASQESTVAYKIGGEWFQMLLRNDLAGSRANGTHALLSDFGRSTDSTTQTNMARWLWTAPRDSVAVHWPNYNNPGYDLLALAVDLLRNTLPGVRPPSIIVHMVPTLADVTALRAHMSARGINSPEATTTWELLATAAASPNDLTAWDRARTRVVDEQQRDLHWWRLPWPQQFYRRPVDVLRAMGHKPVAQPSAGTKLVYYENPQ